MHDISPVGQGSVGAVARVNGAASHVNGTASSQIEPKQTATDRVELSEHARFLNRIRELPDVRSDKVADIRQQISEGTYPSDDKIQVAIERLLDEFDD